MIRPELHSETHVKWGGVGWATWYRIVHVKRDVHRCVVINPLPEPGPDFGAMRREVPRLNHLDIVEINLGLLIRCGCPDSYRDEL